MHGELFILSQFTWFNSDSSIASRLYMFLVVRGLISSLKFCDITPCVFSHHEFVFVTLELGDPPRQGPGVWKLNNSLLEDVILDLCTA